MSFEPEDFEEEVVKEKTAEETVGDDEPIEHECPKCGKTYKSERGLVNHVAKCKGKPEPEAEEKAVWLPTPCPKCGKLYKSQAAYEFHVKSCTGPKPKRVPMTEEERIARRKAGVQRWVEKNKTVQVRLLKDSDDLAFAESQVDSLRDDNEKAGLATYFMGLLAADKKKAIKKGLWEKESL